MDSVRVCGTRLAKTCNITPAMSGPDILKQKSLHDSYVVSSLSVIYVTWSAPYLCLPIIECISMTVTRIPEPITFSSIPRYPLKICCKANFPLRDHHIKLPWIMLMYIELYWHDCLLYKRRTYYTEITVTRDINKLGSIITAYKLRRVHSRCL